VSGVTFSGSGRDRGTWTASWRRNWGGAGRLRRFASPDRLRPGFALARKTQDVACPGFIRLRERSNRPASFRPGRKDDPHAPRTRPATRKVPQVGPGTTTP